VKAKHIPYKGVGAMVTDLIGGQVDFAIAALPSVQSHIKSGALRPIGLLTAQRTPAAPEIPTFAEQGLTNFSVDAWFAVIGPKGMSAERVAYLEKVSGTAARSDRYKDVVAKTGEDALALSAAETKKLVDKDFLEIGEIVKALGLAKN
jgi:tripartite-type tricarboxylate transporter receptor subunit TctC